METPDVSYGFLPSEPDMAVEPYTPGYMVARAVAYGSPVVCSQGGKPVVSNPGGQTLTKVAFIEPDGTETEFVDQQYGGAPQLLPGPSCTNEGTGYSRGTLFVAIDGSAKTFVASNSIADQTWVQPHQYLVDGTLFFADGTRYDVNSAGNPSFPAGHVTGIYDTRGNYTQILLDELPSNSSGDIAGYWVQDPDDRRTFVSLADLGSPPVQDAIQFTGAGGAIRYAYVQYTQMQYALIQGQGQAIQTLGCLFPNLALSLGGSSTFDPYVISAIILPNSEQYSFLYNTYGDVAQITLPTGGAVQYDYPTFTSPTCPTTTNDPSGYNRFTSTVQRRLQQRRVYPGGVTTIPEEKTE
ncbi:MAG: hypothetical protein ABSF64_32750, partial [Bryobacteraceae bacterium]